MRRFVRSVSIASLAAAMLLAQATQPAQPAPAQPPPAAPKPQITYPAELPEVQKHFNDPIIRAMAEELSRMRLLGATGLEPPYYIQYMVEDQESINVTASLGSVMNANRGRVRLPLVQIRTGSYELDNTNHIYAGFGGGSRFDSDQLPLEGSASVLRNHLWLATDRTFKAASESMLVKQSLLKNTNVNAAERVDDFWRVKPVVLIQDGKRDNLDLDAWKARTAKLSGGFLKYPQVLASSVDFTALTSISYQMSSEGTAVRYPDHFTYLRIRASGLAEDGMAVRDAAAFHSFRAVEFPADGAIESGIREVADNVKALTAAPLGDAYSGPVLFEPQAAAQLFAQLLGDNLRPVRKPLAEPGRAVPIPTSEFETRLGSRILPDFFDVVDDAGATTYEGHALIGHYPVDLEGVPPQRVQVVEKGVFKSYLHTRQGIQGFSGSTGHARLLGPFGAKASSISNLFVRALDSKPQADVKRQLLELIRVRNKPYGLLIRKLDYPSSATFGELQAMAAQTAQGGGGGRLVPSPTLVYRVYLDGREELVRGMRFRGLSARSLRDILAATKETAAFDFMNNAAPLALMGAPGFIAQASVVAPGVLFEDLELERIQTGNTKPPLAPPPSLE